MKKLYSFIFALAASFITLTSCVGSLDPEPYGLVDLDLIWTKYNYTKSYVDLITAPDWNSNYSSTAAYCDEAQHVVDRTSGNYYKWISSDFNAGNYMFGAEGYDANYRNIRTCTYYITNEHRIEYEGLDEYERAFWLVKAHFCRAWDYFELMRHFGRAVIYTEVYSTDETYTDVKLNSVEEIADFIISELDWCLEQAENEKSPYAFRWKVGSSEYGLINRGFAWVLKARTALYAASPLFYEEGSKYTWEYAYQINKEAMDVLLAHGYQLFNVTPENGYAFNSYDYYHVYPGDLSMSIDKETILAGTSRLNMWQQNGLPTTKGIQTCAFCPTQELVDAYETTNGEPVLDLENPYLDKEHLQPNYNKNNRLYDPQNPYANRDPRFYASIYYNESPRYIAKPDSLTVYTYEGGNCGISEAPSETFNTRTGYYLRKYNQNNSDEDSNNDGRLHVARLAEMYLNLAECACEAGHISEALDAVNMVRERVGMPIIEEGISQDKLRLRIRNERRIELAYENFRFWDVRRWKIIDQTEEHVSGMKITKENNGKYTYTRFAFPERVGKSQDKYLLFPLSEDEVNKMKELTGDDWQTPGW